MCKCLWRGITGACCYCRDKQGTVWAHRDRRCFAFPSPGEERRVEEGGSGARDCKEVAVLDPFALLYLTEELPSASWVLARNTVRTSCFSLLKGKESPSSLPGSVLLLTHLFWIYDLQLWCLDCMVTIYTVESLNGFSFLSPFPSPVLFNTSI